MKKFEIEMVKLSDIKPHPDNYREHVEDQTVHLRGSIREHGVYKNIVIAKDGTILAGHGLAESARAEGLKELPAIRLKIGPNDKKALKILTGDNEIARLAVVDDRKLSEILKNLAVDVSDLIGTGFDQSQLANLVYVTRPATEIGSFDAAAEWVGLPEYEKKDETKALELVIEISFANEFDRERFVEETKLQIKSKKGHRKWSTFWPFQARNDLISVKFKTKKAT